MQCAQVQAHERKKRIEKSDCMFLSCHVRVSEWIHTIYLSEYKGNLCSKHTQYLKFKWLQRDWNQQPLSS